MKSVFVFLKTEARAILKSIRESYSAAPASLQKAVRRILGGGLIIVLVAIAWNAGSTYYEARQREAEMQKGPHVKIARATVASTERTVSVTGEASPFASVVLYAKVSGYLKKMMVDKGDVVKKGQVLAVIESPETDRAYDATKADSVNKKAISDRMQKLLERNLVSLQEAEQARSDAEISTAHFESQAVLKSYETLRAPFAGTIISRFADPGALVQNAANSQTSALPVLSLSQVDKLRVYIYLDQRDATYVKKGQIAEITLPDNPDLIFKGSVERVSGGLDAKTRMLLTEVDLDNAEGKIVAGSLVRVTLHLSADPGVLVPSEALVLRDGKTMVPVVDENNEVIYSPVKVISNDGENIKLQSGLKEGQIVALNMGNTLRDHSKVRPVEEPAATIVKGSK